MSYVSPITSRSRILLLLTVPLVLSLPLVAQAAGGFASKQPPVCKKGQKSTKKKPCVKPKPPAPKPPTPPAPPVAPAENGHYVGQTSQGQEISFEVGGPASALEITNLTFKFDPTCQPNAVVHATGGSKASIPIKSDGSASATLEPAGSFTATFDGTHRAATGQLQESFSFVAGGTTYQCTSPTITWSAAKQ